LWRPVLLSMQIELLREQRVVILQLVAEEMPRRYLMATRLTLGCLHNPVGQQITTACNLDRRLHAPDKRNSVQGCVCRTPQPSFLPHSGAERGERDHGANKRNRAPDSPRQSGTAPTGNCSSDAHVRFRSKSCALANGRRHLLLGACAVRKTVQRVETIRRSTFPLSPFLWSSSASHAATGGLLARRSAPRWEESRSRSALRARRHGANRERERDSRPG
jgi:hypothetical protein